MRCWNVFCLAIDHVLIQCRAWQAHMPLAIDPQRQARMGLRRLCDQRFGFCRECVDQPSLPTALPDTSQGNGARTEGGAV